MYKFVVSILFSFIIILTTTPSCSDITIKPTRMPSDMLISTDVGGPISFPVTYYIANNFTTEEIIVINNSLLEWETTTKIVKVKLVTNWTPSKDFDPDFYINYPIKTIWKLNESHPGIQKLFKRYGSFAGLSYGNYYVLVENDTDMQTPKRLYTVSMHEFGHQLGMHHINCKYPAIMNSNCEGSKITKWDITQFCYTYNCK